MSACVISGLCISRHATARTRSIASQWTASRPGGGALAGRSPVVPQFAVGGNSSASFEFSTLSGSIVALQHTLAATKDGSSNSGESLDISALSSLFALATAGSVAAANGPSTTSAEADGPKPMATSDFADHDASETSSSSSNARRPVQIRRTVKRHFGSSMEQLGDVESALPSRFHFYKTSDCEPAFTENNKMDLLSASKPYQVSFQGLQGRRETMEDEIKVAGGGRFCAIFDGHGGGDVSKYLRQHLYDLFLLHLERQHWEESDSDIEDIRQHTPSIPAYMTALREALNSVETEILRHSALNFVGSTAVAVVLHENPGGNRTLISANVGDSRAILCRNGKAVDLTKDHKPTAEGERKRILGAGGRIFLDETGVHRVMNLSLSRAIGDAFSKPIVAADPDIRRFRVEDDGDEFILLASDGLWDVMSSQDVVDFVQARLDDARTSAKLTNKEEQEKILKKARSNMAKAVVEEACRLGTADNTSAVMVWLNETQE